MFLIVDYPTFKRIVKKPKEGLEQPIEGQIYYYETPEQFILLYNNDTWKFKTYVSKQELEDFGTYEKFVKEELQNAIYVLNYEKDIEVRIG